MASLRFELVEGTSSKFWEIAVDGAAFVVTFGRIGTAGQSKRKPCQDAAAARAEADKLIAEKTRKGYVQVGGAKAGAQPAPVAKAGAQPAPVAKAKPTARPAAKVSPGGADELGNRSPAPFGPAATGDPKLDALVDELVALPYGDATEARRAALAKDLGARLRKARPEALLGLLSDDAFDLGALVDSEDRPGTPAVKRARKQSWNKVWAERYARTLTLGVLLDAALTHPACDDRLAALLARPSFDVSRLVADAVVDAKGKVAIGPKLLGALGVRVRTTGASSAEGIAHEAVVKALLRAPVEDGFDALAPLVRAWDAAGQDVIETLAQDVDEMKQIPLDPRWRDVLHEALDKKRLAVLPVLAKLPPSPDDVPAVAAAVAGIPRSASAGEPEAPEAALVLLARSRDPRALPALLEALAYDDFGWTLRDLLFPAIAAIGDPAAVEPLTRFITRNEEHDGDDELVKAARAALEKLAPKGAPAPKPTAKAAPAVTARPRSPAGKARAVPKTTAAQERAKVEQVIAKAKLPAAVSAALLAALRPAIRLYTRRVADDALPVGTSHYGGRPDLPPGTPWPRAGKVPMTFVAQLRLEEVAPFDLERRLPARGLLSFFLHDELPEDVEEPETYSAHRVLYTADAAGLERAALPDGFALDTGRTPLATAELRFPVVWELPSALTHEAKALGKEAAALDLPGALDLPYPEPLDQLLGYDHYQGYDDVPAKGTRPLLRVDSDDQADMNFGDAQDVSFRIKDDDLAAARFDRAKLWFQAG